MDWCFIVVDLRRSSTRDYASSSDFRVGPISHEAAGHRDQVVHYNYLACSTERVRLRWLGGSLS